MSVKTLWKEAMPVHGDKKIEMGQRQECIPLPKPARSENHVLKYGML
jgi:hypothetical protein